MKININLPLPTFTARSDTDGGIIIPLGDEMRLHIFRDEVQAIADLFLTATMNKTDED